MKINDFSTPGFFANPYETYRGLREAGPIVGVGRGFWATARYEVANALLCDRRIGRNYMASIVARYGPERAEMPVFQALNKAMLLINPPTHTRLRTLSMKVFTSEQITRTVQYASEIAEQLIDAFEAKGHADIMADFALPLPVMLICTLLGVPQNDVNLFTKAVADVALSVETAPMTDAQIDAANQGIEFMQSYFYDLMQERRNNLGSDLISLLLTAEEGNDRLTQEEIVANVILLFMAGHETTTNMIGNGLVAAHRHPAQLDKVMTHMDLLPLFVAECMRYDTSAQVTSRAAMEDMEIEGIPISRGDTIFIFLGGASRDPEKFSSPDDFIISRPEQGNRVIAFGGGIHYCLGARLAVAELEVAFSTLFRRLPGLKIENLDTIEWHPRNALRGPKLILASW